MGFYSEELCYLSMREFMRPIDHLITFVREPRAHVLSQFYECLDDKWGHWVRSRWYSENNHSGLVNQTFANFSSWIRYFAMAPDMLQTGDFNCYHPYNMQARSFICKAWGLELHHHRRWKWTYEHLLSTALANLQTTFFVGIAEHYQASVCLLLIKATEKLPAFCDCKDEASWAAFSSRKIVHGVRPHSVQDVSDDDIVLVDFLTSVDHVLYQVALKIFQAEISEAHYSPVWARAQQGQRLRLRGSGGGGGGDS
eukprot:CAMPEP_0180420890 /NCGR_PEP_ID=MMETSP1036_2-20121128/2866_1 /TAXON_ID=632150 /ORGANISM="Azadinium spinosum, Strain 3D9" /LENGTH=253 /DNA_ID=CAMNT_0022426133 /DNA_START=181 /DNA_END=939 /DNA_ORIENTATION=-